MAKVEILKVGHALVQGARGEKGGKPSKDSIYGVATVQGNLVTFGGRRGAVTFRFKTHKKVDQEAVLAAFAGKLVKAQGGFNYRDVTGTPELAELVPNIETEVGKMYYKAMANKKLNTRATAKPAKVEKAKVEAKTETTDPVVA